MPVSIKRIVDGPGTLAVLAIVIVPLLKKETGKLLS
jgi:hypothetical protein